MEVDRDKVVKQGVNLADVYQSLQCFMGGAFVNYFNSFGRQWQVYVQAEGEYRTKVDYLGQFYVRNNDGNMVPLAALTRVKNTVGPEFTMRYNLYRSAQINVTSKPGISSAQAMKALEDVFCQHHAPGNGFRLSRHELPGKGGAKRRLPDGDFWHLAALCFPDSRRAV